MQNQIFSREEIRRIENEGLMDIYRTYQHFFSTQRDAKRCRMQFSTEQINLLEAEFKKYRYISDENRKKIAYTLQIKETDINIWFHNRRLTEKRENNIDYNTEMYIYEHGDRFVEQSNGQLEYESLTPLSNNQRSYSLPILLSNNYRDQIGKKNSDELKELFKEPNETPRKNLVCDATVSQNNPIHISNSIIMSDFNKHYPVITFTKGYNACIIKEGSHVDKYGYDKKYKNIMQSTSNQEAYSLSISNDTDAMTIKNNVVPEAPSSTITHSTLNKPYCLSKVTHNKVSDSVTNNAPVNQTIVNRNVIDSLPNNKASAEFSIQLYKKYQQYQCNSIQNIREEQNETVIQNLNRVKQGESIKQTVDTSHKVAPKYGNPINLQDLSKHHRVIEKHRKNFPENITLAKNYDTSIIKIGSDVEKYGYKGKYHAQSKHENKVQLIGNQEPYSLSISKDTDDTTIKNNDVQEIPSSIITHSTLNEQSQHISIQNLRGKQHKTVIQNLNCIAQEKPIQETVIDTSPNVVAKYKNPINPHDSPKHRRVIEEHSNMLKQNANFKKSSYFPENRNKIVERTLWKPVWMPQVLNNPNHKLTGQHAKVQKDERVKKNCKCDCHAKAAHSLSM